MKPESYYLSRSFSSSIFSLDKKCILFCKKKSIINNKRKKSVSFLFLVLKINFKTKTCSSKMGLS